MAKSHANTAVIRLQSDPRPTILDSLEFVPQQYNCRAFTESGVQYWGVWERCYSATWLLVARCPDQRSAAVITAYMNGHLRDSTLRGHGRTCVPICSITEVCETCHGTGEISDGVCPVCLKLLEEWYEIRDVEAA